MRGFDNFKKLFEYFLRVKNLLFNHGGGGGNYKSFEGNKRMNLANFYLFSLST